LLALVLGCGEGEEEFTAKLASDFTPVRHTVSVLGLYKDGLMSSEGWGTVAPHMAPALGSGRCEIGYDGLVSSNPPLAQAIDEFARANGPTDDLLAQLAPAARGDLLLVLTFAGKLPQKSSADAGASGEMAPSTGGTSRGNRGMGGGSMMRGRPPPEPPKDTNAVDISASLYSVQQRRPVALVALRYAGTSLDDALTKFGAKLAETLPGLQCAGWNWDVPIDPDRIRSAIDK
jgi:hypothetical protein